MDVRLLDTFACSVVRNVVDRTGRIQNGLKGDGAAVADVESLCLSVNLTYLANVTAALLRWELFVEKFPVEGWCADQVRSGSYRLLRDWEVLRTLNRCNLKSESPDGAFDTEALTGWRSSAMSALNDLLDSVELLFGSRVVKESALVRPTAK